MGVLLEAALLGVVQGLTEFLPVSSSAHLILARAFFGWDPGRFGIAFDVACHVGTLVAVLVYFRREIAQMLASVSRILRTGPPEAGRHRGGDEGARLIWLLGVGTIPTIGVGLLFNDAIEEHFRTPQVAAAALALGAIGFFIAERVGAKTRGEESLTMREAFWVGCAQAAALIPGVSRSGATITMALLLGLRRAESARFIFLLAIPAIFGAAGHEAPEVIQAGLGGEIAMRFLIGAATSALVGYLAVRFFIRYLGNHSLAVFGWYRLALAATVVVWLFVGRPL